MAWRRAWPIFLAALPLAVRGTDLVADQGSGCRLVPEIVAEDDECSAVGTEAPADGIVNLEGLSTSHVSLLQRRTRVDRDVATDGSLADQDGLANATSNIMLLYHQTDEHSGRSILQTGFNRGHGGICGAAIYFSPSARDTDIKAVGGRGYVIEAKVDMGRIKVMSPLCDESMTAHKLKDMGYDSITLDRGYMFECWFIPSCKEYIIYDRARIVSMRGFKYNGMNQWMGPHARSPAVPEQPSAPSPPMADEAP